MLIKQKKGKSKVLSGGFRLFNSKAELDENHNSLDKICVMLHLMIILFASVTPSPQSPIGKFLNFSLNFRS